MEKTKKIKIERFEEFKEQLKKVKESQSEIILSYYKYCHLYDNDEDLNFDFYKDLILDELKPYGLEPINITKDLDLIFRFKNKAEAVIHIKPFGIDYLVYKLWLCHRM